MKVAIIGAGVAGAAAVKTIVEENQQGLISHVDVFEERNQLGVGSPYEPDSKQLLMNSYVGDLGFEWQDSDHYLRWLQDHYPEYAERDIFSPRPIFGEYIQDYFRPYFENEIIHVVNQRIHQLKIKSKQSYYLFDENGKQYGPYDSVIMTVGHPPYADHYNLLGNENYIHHPYPVEQVLSDLDYQKNIGIIGSGLTGIDIMRYLQDHYPITIDHPVTFYILDQPFSTPKFERYAEDLIFNLNAEWIDKQLAQSDNQTIPLETIFHQFEADMEANGVNWKALVERYSQGSIGEGLMAIHQQNRRLSILQLYGRKLTAFLPALNMALSSHDRIRFFKDFMGLFEHFRSQTPAESIEFILQGLRDGRIRIVSGMKDVEVNDQGFTVVTQKGLRYQTGYLVNATGFDQNLDRAAPHDPLINQMYQEGVIQANPLGGILVDWPHTQVLSQKYGLLDHLYLTGHWIFSTQFGNNNTKLTYKQAEACVKHLLDSAKQV
ncbi:FAD/NAD(P)-binding protein [Facklamia sp. 7083-14-GEN3]|uniref:FAD/NAD(P)-binding protein n=1 Tax=Facklamia sp. 7083-14-GEN3 TaxID=2973478 RepID=UPI00215D16CB|nr:FAD/NAD(P)-binding protein [Facklamia sp. 7083-14-GEN3]MCR8968918.1 FAD/NAD(P)-binding protein [Facklamia sp. 7083-14-GEN3]